MQQIDCPWCGKRNETEFTCGGELITRPEDALNASDQAWTDYLYFRDNKKGVHTEVWRHTYGCRQWFKAERNTLTHEVMTTRMIAEEIVEDTRRHG